MHYATLNVDKPSSWALSYTNINTYFVFFPHLELCQKIIRIFLQKKRFSIFNLLKAIQDSQQVEFHALAIWSDLRKYGLPKYRLLNDSPQDLVKVFYT